MGIWRMEMSRQKNNNKDDWEMYGKNSTLVEIEENFKCVHVYMYFPILYLYIPLYVYTYSYTLYTPIHSIYTYIHTHINIHSYVSIHTHLFLCESKAKKIWTYLVYRYVFIHTRNTEIRWRTILMSPWVFNS